MVAGWTLVGFSLAVSGVGLWSLVCRAKGTQGRVSDPGWEILDLYI